VPRRAKPRTLDSLITEYRASQDFTRLSQGSKRVYLRAMDLIGGAYGEAAIDALRRRHVLVLRDSLSETPAIANQMLVAFSVLMNFAIDREYRGDNPAFRVKKMRVGEYEAWPHEAIDFALDNLPEVHCRAILLALYTGQREGDCIAMQWSNWDGAGIHCLQQKTKAKLWIPCHSKLNAALAEWKRSATAVTILTNSDGLPWAGKSFPTGFSREMKKHKFLAQYQFHGLRKSAAAFLAEAGCSTLEIMSITGHRTLSMVEHYTKQADQRSRASAAILKLERNRN